MSLQNKLIGGLLVLIGGYGIVILIPTAMEVPIETILANLGLAVGLIVIGIYAFTRKKKSKILKLK